ncbi:MAG: GNAT family N-acetyltransferase [Candidatus Thermoplasmatota archaeon]|nr:GNAT family N-acetyltransferase [Candidatus Thermoplasmatota archaeon]MBS3790324.1 GNAT family N-acetyltransferase [Candidatus Thermoplasmatota archaeon]
MELRTPSIEEYEKIIELWDEAGLPYKPEGRDTKENIEEELEEQPEYWIGAYVDKNLIGIIFGTDDGRKGWINRLAVAEDYRGRGIGRKLVEELERVFEQKGFKIWAALIEPDNPDAMKFFEHLDFEEFGIKYYSKRENEKV